MPNSRVTRKIGKAAPFFPGAALCVDFTTYSGPAPTPDDIERVVRRAREFAPIAVIDDENGVTTVHACGPAKIITE